MHWIGTIIWHGSKPCIAAQRGKTTLGHHSLERHRWGPMETDDTSHARKTTEGSQRPRTHRDGTDSKIHFTLPDDPDTTTTTAAAPPPPPSQETTSRENNTIDRRTNACEASRDRSRESTTGANNKNRSLSSKGQPQLRQHLTP